ncbi:gliding motility-associated C-terminal domain-containing protein [Flavobacterium sediminilitoris]|uniref:Gliding motility-associated C-terminal domain-containing protein n=1 Tax=Flavobacterium sediminilitoris TaxID=2024526 RepID=A0ABY4HK27_9FLAO|nr:MULTISPECIES: gliding motility-associated C-terminal domain-containing protein [Flavobacterium]UOX33210.1 gliding motility-associated C-terminal domain-containing protein [Flavobacterium sediminilitoris]
MENFYFKNCFEKWKVIALLFFLIKLSYSEAQTLVYAQSIISESEVDNSGNAADLDQTTFAVVRASTGIAVGIGSYSGHLELEFPTTLPANTTSYVKIESDDNLLEVLLGGSLGNILSDVLGIVLIGNQEFTIQAKMNNSIINVGSGSSQIPNAFATPSLRVVINELGEYFLAVTPNQPYNRIRLTNRVGSLLGLNNTKNLKVYSAHYISQSNECGNTLYTSFNGSGLTVDLIELGGAGVNNPENVIDSDLNSYSELSLGILNVAASIEQTVYFDGLSNPNDVFNIRLRLDPSLVTLGVANNITISSYNGANVANSISLNGLLNLDLLTLLQNNEIVSIPYSPGMAVDRITIQYSALLNVSAFQKLDLFDITRTPPAPTIDVSSQNLVVCSGSSASLIAHADPSTLQIYWYDVPSGGTPIGMVNSGEAFITPAITTATTFYAAAKNPNCPDESVRTEVTVNVNTAPTGNNLSVTGNENPICAINSVVITPSSSTITGTFHWYFDANATNEITDGLINGNITYSIDSNGVLTINGLTTNDSPVSYYLSITDSNTQCSNNPGDLKEVIITIIDEATPTTNDTTQEFCVSQNATVADIQVNESPIAWYTASTGGTPLDPTTLLTNGMYYAAIVGTTCESSVRLEVTVTISDEATPTTNDTTQEFCVSQNATVADIQVNESPIAWYTASTGGTPLDPTTLLTNGMYYAAIVGTTCESSVRLEVTVTISDEATPTTNDTTQEFCVSQNATVADIQVNEFPIAWYTASTGGTPLDPTTLLTNGMYYAAIVGTTCESSVRLEVTVIINSTSDATIDGETANICFSNEYTYTTEPNMTNYQWSVTGGLITSGGDSSSNFVTIEWNEVTTGNVNVTYSGATLCSATASASLDIPITVCSDLTITKVANVSQIAVGETIVFTITVSNNGTSDIQNIEVLEDLPSGYNYVSNTTTIGTYDSSTNLWLISQLLAGQSATLQITVTINASGNFTNTATILNSDPVDSNPDNNVAIAEVMVICLTVYNEFSPNNDGENEFFIIDCIENYPNNKLEIFNRYGNMVYETKSYQNTWNGISNVNGVIKQGESVPVGTYFYSLKVDELNISKSGWIYVAK